MGHDLYSYCERKDESGVWVKLDFSPFEWRFYAMYGFLANIRNYAEVPFISELKGVPVDTVDVDEFKYADQYASWLTVDELNSYNYEILISVNTYIKEMYSTFLCQTLNINVDIGTKITLRGLLGERFFSDLNRLNAIKAERVIFWFLT